MSEWTAEKLKKKKAVWPWHIVIGITFFAIARGTHQLWLVMLGGFFLSMGLGRLASGKR